MWFLAVPLAFVALFLILPIVAIFERALEEKGVGGTLALVTDPLFVDAAKLTVILALGITLLCLVGGIIYALALALAAPWLRLVLFIVIFVTFWVSVLVRTYGWILVFRPTGTLDSVLVALGVVDESAELLQSTAAIFPGMVHIMLPYTVLPIYASLMSLDQRQLWSGQSLGASPTLILRRVIIPQLRPGIIAGVTLVFILSLGMFVTPAFLGGPGDFTIATLIDRQFRELFDFGAAAGMAAVLLIVCVLCYLCADWLFKINERLRTD